jgi:hypothetical protein
MSPCCHGGTSSCLCLQRALIVHVYSLVWGTVELMFHFIIDDYCHRVPFCLSYFMCRLSLPSYSAVANSHTHTHSLSHSLSLCSSLQHVRSLLSLLYLHRLSPGNGFQIHSFIFRVYVLTGRRPSHN